MGSAAEVVIVIAAGPRAEGGVIPRIRFSRARMSSAPKLKHYVRQPTDQRNSRAQARRALFGTDACSNVSGPKHRVGPCHKHIR